MLTPGQQQGGVLGLTVSSTLRPPLQQTLHACRSDWSDLRGLLSRRRSKGPTSCGGTYKAVVAYTRPTSGQCCRWYAWCGAAVDAACMPEIREDTLCCSLFCQFLCTDGMRLVRVAERVWIGARGEMCSLGHPAEGHCHTINEMMKTSSSRLVSSDQQ